ncbi:DUF1846 domain-containing protein [Allobaculum mucilyticum]|uniref:DUF1846 domain-containing protein n=1 Tax=Allobaculum mucilyticum TaxID=2834459 RepID=UPI001E2AC99E|nr:DUF1846 domain-containing protein [Allobaculum mucilyticum]UNT96957.1 DUF1846 domain-containing protein [Allobaculum mucilyticum]
MKQGFDNNKYLKMQSDQIRKRIDSFGGKLYLEFGGKLFDDYHASRVLPGFQPDSKLQMLLELKDKAEIVIAISAKDIDAAKMREDLQIPYDQDVLRLIGEFQKAGLFVSSVVITQYAGQKSAQKLKRQLHKKNIRVYYHYHIEGYPTDTKKIISKEGFGKNDYIETERELVVVTAPGPGSGKMATCLSQLYHEHQRGVKAGYAKFETFPIWSIALNHPVNLAYEAATADLDDKNMIDPYHLEAYGKVAVNYNRDIEIFPVLKKMFEEIYGTSPYNSPTDMGVNMSGFCIYDDEAVSQAAGQEIIRRYFASRTRLAKDECAAGELQKQEMLLQQCGLSPEDRLCVKAAREHEAVRKTFCGAMELEDGTMIRSANNTFMGPSAGLVMNAIKKLAGIEDAKLLIEPDAFRPIQNLKTSFMGSINPRLHTYETLIALSLSAKTNPDAQKALDQLPRLKGAQAHLTCDLSETDLNTYSALGIQVTYEPEKR